MALSRWFAPAVLAAAFGAATLAPAPAQAQSSDLIRAVVDIADVVFRGGQPYYRHGDYGRDDRLVVSRDRYGRPVYHRIGDGYGDRYEDRYGDRYGDRYDDRYRSAPPYGRAYGYHNQAASRGKCNKKGKCKVEYYDPRYDRGRYDDRRWDRD